MTVDEDDDLLADLVLLATGRPHRLLECVEPDDELRPIVMDLRLRFGGRVTHPPRAAARQRSGPDGADRPG